MLRRLFAGLGVGLMLLATAATGAASAATNNHDKARLQRGARLFMNYCSGCHSLKYLRYNQMAEGLGLIAVSGHIDEGLLKNNLIFTQASINSPIEIAMPAEDARQWFGTEPPDLSLIVRAKGATWLYTYLTGFYNDDSRPWGSNNYLVPDVAMPDVLSTLHADIHSPAFTVSLADLVAFLSYVSEPMQAQHRSMGFFVLGFLVLLFLLLWRLKIVYWRKIGINSPKKTKMC